MDQGQNSKAFTVVELEQSGESVNTLAACPPQQCVAHNLRSETDMLWTHSNQ